MGWDIYLEVFKNYLILLFMDIRKQSIHLRGNKKDGPSRTFQKQNFCHKIYMEWQ